MVDYMIVYNFKIDGWVLIGNWAAIRMKTVQNDVGALALLHVCWLFGWFDSAMTTTCDKEKLGSS